MTAIIAPSIERWERKFAYLPVYIQPTDDSLAAAYFGDARQPTYRVWWQYYERRYTGRSTSLHRQYEYKLPKISGTLTAWEQVYFG